MKRRREAPPRTFECPHCGAEVRVGAAVCRECGSDADTGWQDEEEVAYQSLDLPTGYSTDPDHPGEGLVEHPRRWVAVVVVVLVVALVVWLIQPML